MSLTPEDCSDGELAALALSGRQAAYTALLGRYREPVFRVVRATIGDDDDAVDVIQKPSVVPDLIDPLIHKFHKDGGS